MFENLAPKRSRATIIAVIIVGIVVLALVVLFGLPHHLG